MSNDSVTDTVTGTGAAINISLGWIPSYVEITNITDGDRIDKWYNGMSAATSVKIDTAVASQASNGISSYAGDSTHAPGFTIGSAISESAKVLRYLAVRGGTAG